MKKQSLPVRSLQKHLNAVHRTTHKFASDAEYWFLYDGPLWQNVNRWHQRKWRKKGLITRHCKAAMKDADTIGNPEIIKAVERIRRLAKIVTDHCDYFPDNRNDVTDWTGQEFLSQLDTEITKTRLAAPHAGGPV